LSENHSPIKYDNSYPVVTYYGGNKKVGDDTIWLGEGNNGDLLGVVEPDGNEMWYYEYNNGVWHLIDPPPIKEDKTYPFPLKCPKCGSDNLIGFSNNVKAAYYCQSCGYEWELKINY